MTETLALTGLTGTDCFLIIFLLGLAATIFLFDEESQLLDDAAGSDADGDNSVHGVADNA